jgi:hypothetical protein
MECGSLGGAFELPAEARELALLTVVEDGEGVLDPERVSREELLHQRAAGIGEADRERAPVSRVCLAADQAALLEGRGDLAGVCLAQPEALPERPEAEDAAGRFHHHQHPEGGRGEPPALELATELARHPGLSTDEGVQRPVCERVLEQNREITHVVMTLSGAPDEDPNSSLIRRSQVEFS